MRKVMGKVKRTLSVVLAVAMVVTMVPQTGMAVYAQEENPAIETEEEAVVDVLTPEETTEVSTEDPEDADEAPAEDAQTEDAEDGSVNEDEGAEDVEAPAEETPEAEEPADEETPEVTEGDKSVTDNEVMDDEVLHTVTATFTDDVEITSTAAGLETITNGSGVQVNEGQDLTFTVKLKDEKKADKYISKLTYQVSDASEVDKTADAKSGSCTFTISKDDFKGDVTITVETADIPTHTVTFAGKTNVAKVTEIKVDGKDYDPTEYPKSEDDGNWKVTAKEGQTVSFKLEAEEFYKVTEVKNGETVLEADKDGVYSLTIGEDDANLTVGTELDETQAYTFVFKVKGNKGSAKATVAWADGVDYGSDDVPEPDENGKLVTRNSKVKVTITADPKYDLGEVTVNGEKRDPSESNEYEVALEKGKTVTLEVATTPKGRESAATLAFANKASHVELKEVKIDGTAAKADEESGKYAVADKAKELEFTLVATGPYLPSIAASDESQAEVELKDEKLDTKTNKTTYTYYVLAKDLADDETFTITEEDDMKTIAIEKQGDGDVNVVKSINGKAMPDEAEEVLRGTAVTFKVTAADNSNLTSVDVDGKAQKISNKKTSEFTVTVNANTKITVTAEGLYKASALKDESGNDLTPVKNVYNVSYDGKYKADVLKGSEAAVLSDVKVLDSTKKEIEGVGKVDDDTTTAVIDLKEAEASKVAGQKLTVELYVADNDKAVATYTLSVSKVVSTITLPATASQAMGTVKSYTIKTDGEISKLEVKPLEEGDKNVVTEAKIDPDKGVLVITTGLNKGDVDVTVTTGDDENAVSATIKVTTTPLISSTTAAPSVKLKAASDVSLTLTLGSKLNDELAENGGKVYYEVKADVKNPDVSANVATEDGTVKLEEHVVQYFERTSDSKDYTVNVGKEQYNELGQGGAWTYDVTVALVHVDGDVVPTKDNIDTEIVKYGDDKSRSKQGKVTCKTQVPAYETTLKLKKGKTTTVYTGQSGVIVATPQFSKTTTYTLLEDENVVDISYSDPDEALELSVNDNGDIVASASKKTVVGKHMVQVTANAPGTMYAARATIVINVVRGIEDLSVNVPSYSVYKAPKKAATLKATPVYNYGYTGSYWTPKTKKVTWDVVGTDHSSSVDAMVSIDKNGKVTVKKDYTLKANDDDNTFVIKVTANDFAGNTTVGYSAPITITNVGEDVNTLAVVLYDNSDNKYKVAAIPNGKDPVKIEASKVSRGYVKAFRSGVSDLAVGKEYEDEEALNKDTVPVSNLSFKSSSTKILTVSASGYIRVLKPGKVKLTATANDGSKAKAELSLNIDYDSTAVDGVQQDLGLSIYPYKVKEQNEDNYIYYTETIDWENPIYNIESPAEKDPAKLEFSGSATARLAVQVEMKNSGSYKSAPYYTNYQLKVVGGKVTAQDGQYAYITANNRNVKITLTDKTTGKTAEYNLTNTGITDVAQFKPTVKVAGNLHRSGKVKEQVVTFNLSKISADYYTKVSADEGSKLAAKVEVDWTAMKNTNQYDLTKFAGMMKSNVFEIADYANGTGSFELGFSGRAEDYIYFYQNSYKLKVTIGSLKGDVFTPATAAAAATVKVTKTKTFTFKPTTSYKIATRDGGAVLTGKGNIPVGDFTVYFSELKNANIKGVENNFRDIFEIKDGNKLVVKAGVDPSKIGKMTGYLTYTAYANTGYYNPGSGTGTNTVKITVQVNDKKAAAKYAAVGKPQIGSKQGSETVIEVTVGGVKTDMAYAMENATGWKAEAADGKIKLTNDNASELKIGKSYSVKLLVVPKGSFYEEAVKTAKEQEDEGKAYKEAMQKYGVALTVSVKAIEKKSPADQLESWLAKLPEEKPTWLRNKLERETLAQKINNAKDDIFGADSGISVEVESSGYDSMSNLAQVGKAGEITGTIKLTGVAEGESDTVTLKLVIPENAITSDEAATIIENDQSLKEITVNKADLDSPGKDDKEAEILNAAKAAIGGEYYNKVTVEVDLASSSGDKQATITLKVTQTDSDSNSATKVLTYDIADATED